VLRTRAVSAVAIGDYITLTVRPLFTSIHTNSDRVDDTCRLVARRVNYTAHELADWTVNL